MHRFRVSSVKQDSFEICGEEFHHLINVLRLKAGDEIYGFDNSGRQWRAVIEHLQKDSAFCRILQTESPQVEARTRIFLVMGLAKGEKMEWVIQKATELGMSGFVPLRARRSVVQVEGKKAEERVGRWQRIAAEAAKQCRRVVEPQVERVSDWNDLKELLPPGTQWLLPYEEEKSQSLSNALSGFHPERPIAILIGPEGGFTPEEAGLAVGTLGARSVSLGPRILRTETAALAALVMVLTYYGDLG